MINSSTKYGHEVTCFQVNWRSFEYITQAHQTQGHSLRFPNSRLSQAAHVATSNAWAICDHDLHPPLEPPHLRCNTQNQKNRQGKLFSSKFLGSSVFLCPKKNSICSYMFEICGTKISRNICLEDKLHRRYLLKLASMASTE